MPAELHSINTDRRGDEGEAWSRLYSRWLAIKAEWAQPPEDEDDNRASQRTMEEAEVVRAMTATYCPRGFLRQKLDVFEDALFSDSTSDWADRRDRLLLASIKEDVEMLP